MAQQNQNLCIFNKYGYCKFKYTCRKQHIQEKCSNEKYETRLKALETCLAEKDVNRKIKKFGNKN